MRQQSLSARAMARALGRSPSRITLGFARNTLASILYASHTAQVVRGAKRTAAHPELMLDFCWVAWGASSTMLDWKWSPQKIAATLKRVFPDEPERHASHEANDTASYEQPRRELRKQLVACLRHGRSIRMPRTRCEGRCGQVPDMVSIHVRQPEVDDRVMLGHSEGDFTSRPCENDGADQRGMSDRADPVH